MTLTDQLKELVIYLQGKKSYITGIFLALYSLLQVFNVLTFTQEQNLAILGLLGAIFGLSLKAGITRENKAILGKMENQNK